MWKNTEEDKMDLNELEEKAGKVFMGVNKKFEGIEQKIFENTR